MRAGKREKLKHWLSEGPIIRGRSDGIDALRAVLALWVVFAHLVLWVPPPQGKEAIPAWLTNSMQALGNLFQAAGELHPAVIAFIVLSGYCIHRAGFRAVPESIRQYALRRGFRIFPVFFAAIAVGIVSFSVATGIDAYLGFGLSGGTQISTACVIAKITGVAALVPFFHPCAYVGNAPLATVMVEIWLYVVYATVFVLLIWRGKERMLWYICVGAYCAGLLVAAFATPWFYNWWQNSSLLGFLPYWWIGTLFVHPTIAKRSRAIAVISFATWLVITLSPMDHITAEIRKLVFCGIVGPIIVLTETARGPLLFPFSAVGRAGYSLYAFHAPVIYVLALLGVSWWLIVAATLAVAGLSYALLEGPLTRMGKKISYPSRADASSHKRSLEIAY